MGEFLVQNRVQLKRTLLADNVWTLLLISLVYVGHYLAGVDNFSTGVALAVFGAAVLCLCRDGVVYLCVLRRGEVKLYQSMWVAIVTFLVMCFQVALLVNLGRLAALIWRSDQRWEAILFSALSLSLVLFAVVLSLLLVKRARDVELSLRYPH